LMYRPGTKWKRQQRNQHCIGVRKRAREDPQWPEGSNTGHSHSHIPGQVLGARA
jgi:hypothetical protein